MERPRFVVADTMDLWIETARPDLDALLPRVDLLIFNDSEARQMTKETSLIKAGREIREWVRDMSRSRKANTARCFLARTNFSAAALIRWKTFTIRPGQGTHSPAAWPVIWPAHVQENVTFDVLRKAMIYGSVLASFCVEAFSLERLRKLTRHEIADRYQMFKMMSQFEVLT